LTIGKKIPNRKIWIFHPPPPPPEKIYAPASFKSLSIKDKKRFILELLDKNMLYVNLCDLDDEDYKISEKDKEFTRSFYGLKDE
jgi:adenine-specific DNA-methyltransferase